MLANIPLQCFVYVVGPKKDVSLLVARVKSKVLWFHTVKVCDVMCVQLLKKKATKLLVVVGSSKKTLHAMLYGGVFLLAVVVEVAVLRSCFHFARLFQVVTQYNIIMK